MKNIGDSWAAGSGIFETIRVEDQQIFALHRHHCRAKEAAKNLGMQIPTEEFVAIQSYQIVKAEDFKLGRLRWYFDKSGNFAISYVPYKDPISYARLKIVEERSNYYRMKNKEFPYKNLRLLDLVQSDGFDDGIILTEDGQLSETAVASLLLRIDGTWVTPPLASGILNGVVRALVLEAGLAKVRRIEESELANVEAGLLLTSLRNSQNIGEISGRQLSIDNEKCAEIHQLMNEFKGR
jgi:para-aminobenzoate synthetase/4-amino-4-deoxychorismate lyase